MPPPREGATVKILPDFRFGVTWNYGRSLASFDEMVDLADFVQRVLPKLEIKSLQDDAQQN